LGPSYKLSNAKYASDSSWCAGPTWLFLNSHVHPTVTCQLGQIDRYYSRRFAFFPQLLHSPSVSSPPNASVSSSKKKCLRVTNHPRSAPLLLLSCFSPPPRNPMGCFLGCFGGAKERRRRSSKRLPAHSPNGRARVSDSIRSPLCFSCRSFQFLGLDSNRLMVRVCDCFSPPCGLPRRRLIWMGRPCPPPRRSWGRSWS
jgi:hypothetical protein